MNDNSVTNELVELTAYIVSAYVSNNSVTAADLPNLIDQTHTALSTVASKASQPLVEKLDPAVSIKKSVTADALTCLECGKKFKSLKRHLRTDHDLTPEDYRDKWSLGYDYPVVAPNYAAARSTLAKKMGLGRKRGA